MRNASFRYDMQASQLSEKAKVNVTCPVRKNENRIYMFNGTFKLCSKSISKYGYWYVAETTVAQYTSIV